MCRPFLGQVGLGLLTHPLPASPLRPSGWLTWAPRLGGLALCVALKLFDPKGCSLDIAVPGRRRIAGATKITGLFDANRFIDFIEYSMTSELLTVQIGKIICSKTFH
jgi:hypothetical protein